MLNQGNFLKPAVGSVVVVEDIEDMTLPRCEYYNVCKSAGRTFQACPYQKNYLDNYFEPTLQYKMNMMKHCANCGQSDD